MGKRLSKREFTIENEYHYNQAGPVRWILAHLWRYKRLILCYTLASIMANAVYASVSLLIGAAFNAALARSLEQLSHTVLLMLGTIALGGCADVGARIFPEFVGKRVARDARQELYLSLLGKSQTFHNRHRVGDIMARAANDMTQLSNMVTPGMDILFDSNVSLTMTLIFIASINFQLLLVPLLFAASFWIAVRIYTRKLAPVSDSMREQFGEMNAGLNETISGIEVVKAAAQEQEEIRKFEKRAGLYRDLFIRNGYVQSWYLPPLLLSFALVFAFLHALFLVAHNQISVGSLVAFMGLMVVLRYPAFNTNWAFNTIQLGVAGAGRILNILKEETELDENEGGYSGDAGGMRGEIVFEHVTFSYKSIPVLKDISFRAAPGQTIAIVGQTGAGKSTLTKLINRTYDVESGRILVDGVDVRDWNLDALRSQISTIEQDIFLFSRSIAENIAYGLGQKADQAAIEQAARDAQAHQFIMDFKDGYETEIGERGVTLSGGQRQRIAIARALLTDPRILSLDESTSAIDSATEDEIQQAIRRVLEGRTTLLITHRLSQIRQADQILVLRQGELIDQGNHDELLARCNTYRRIFAHYGKPQSEPSQMRAPDMVKIAGEEQEEAPQGEIEARPSRAHAYGLL